MRYHWHSFIVYLCSSGSSQRFCSAIWSNIRDNLNTFVHTCVHSGQDSFIPFCMQGIYKTYKSIYPGSVEINQIFCLFWRKMLKIFYFSVRGDKNKIKYCYLKGWQPHNIDAWPAKYIYSNLEQKTRSPNTFMNENYNGYSFFVTTYIHSYKGQEKICIFNRWEFVMMCATS